MREEPPSNRLGTRASAVFDGILAGRTDAIHPDDRAEAEAFWTWLGRFDHPGDGVPVAPPAHRRRWPLGAALAATLIASIGVGTWLSARDKTVSSPPRGAEYAAERAERRVLRLTDGSVVTLGGASRVALAYTPAERRIRLTEGEALFNVAHDSQRPFIVEVAHGEIRAVGTAFDVRVAPNQAAVTVVSGVVRIALRGPSVDGARGDTVVKSARKGEQVRFGMLNDGGESVGFISQTKEANVDQATAWTRGVLVFRGEPLAQVVATINRYTHDTVVVTDPRNAALPIYGVVDQGDTSALRELVHDPRVISISKARPGGLSGQRPAPR
ncbi:FecR family protein [Sphingomonas flavalba]|uniref:FecR family protein n=1 Tax=Sphingomonas flavalba TaxID=2559804 RepID=UPI0039E1426E